MNLRDLDYICTVARLKHFGRAAKACHVSQPTLSSQIIKLERELGVPIFERIRGAVKVTKEGTAIIEAAERARSAAQDIKNIAKSFSDPFSGDVSLGVIPTIGPFLLPYFSGALFTTYPKLNLAYIEDMTERLTAQLLGGTLDAAILATPPYDDNLISVPLYNEHFHVALPNTHKLCRQESISLADLDTVTLLLLNEGHCLRDQALSVCSNTLQNQAIRATSLDTLIGLVAGGHGATLIPTLAIRENWITGLGVTVRPLSSDIAYRQVNITYRKSYTRPRLIEALRTIITAGLPTSVEKL